LIAQHKLLKFIGTVSEQYLLPLNNEGLFPTIMTAFEL